MILDIYLNIRNILYITNILYIYIYQYNWPMPVAADKKLQITIYRNIAPGILLESYV